ncbi:hypothetical protein [Catellatospora sp. NPDC049133]|uniref:hypothetical protein n=1 Tax=Catellatospora sp. NPDC049133 TaxID=3155499 RepID=UPI0033D00598
MSESQPLDAADFDLLDQIRDLHETVDPMPADLVERSLFALASRQLAAEIARLQAEQPVAARSTEHTRTLTFEAHSLTIMVTLTEAGRGRLRVDGWLAPAAPLRVELRRATGSQITTADEAGRFAFPEIEPGLGQLLVFRDHPHEPWIVTPAVAL